MWWCIQDFWVTTWCQVLFWLQVQRCRGQMIPILKDLPSKTSRSSISLSPAYIRTSRGNAFFPELSHQLYSFFMLTSPTSKTFFFGVTWAESSSAWRTAWQEGWRLLHCQSVQNIVVDHLEAETGGRWWSREEIASILKVLSGEVKAKEENSDLLLPQVSQPLLFTNLKCYSLDFPWETLRFLDPPLSWRFPLVQDHQCSHLTSRLGKDLSEEGEMSVVWGGLLYQRKSWFLFHSPHHISITLRCFSS